MFNSAPSSEETAIVADPILLAARDQARAALAEITDAKTIGVDAGHDVHEERVVTLYFESTLAGYNGWRWAAAVTRVDDESPVTVLEVEMVPGPDSLVAPEWVPWSERMSQYRDAQARQIAEDMADVEEEDAEAAADELDDDIEGDEDDVMTNDYSDFSDFEGVSLEGEDDDSDDEDSDDEDSDDEDSDIDDEDELDLVDEASDLDGEDDSDEDGEDDTEEE